MEMLSEVVVTFRGGSADPKKTASKIVLTNATILSVGKSGEYELIKLTYQSIEVTYAKGGKTMTDDWNAPS